MTQPCLFVIFGAGGDLSNRLLIPALYYLARASLLPEQFAVVGVTRHPLDDEKFRNHAFHSLEEHVTKEKFDRSLANQVLERFHHFQGDATDLSTARKLGLTLNGLDERYHTGKNILFYLATPPELFKTIPQALAASGLFVEENYWRRVVVEKPIGHDLESALDLNASLAKVLKEDQIFRIDHYLGKETVQNILVFRFANVILEPIWNHNYVDSVQISVPESIGIFERGAYYDSAGALRDMVPNHLFQLLALIAMEAPISFAADDVRNEKVKVLRAIKPFNLENIEQQVVRGQYEGYRDEKKVRRDSHTETFVALKLELDNWRWAGVPFYLRTGKRMNQRRTEVVIKFKCPPFQLFREAYACGPVSNLLILEMEPEQRITWGLTAKVPGPALRLNQTEMMFDYARTFGYRPETGYERLLHDCINGEHTLFQRADQVAAAWTAITPILELWNRKKSEDLPSYQPGTWGPAAAAQLLARDGRSWRNPT